MDTAILNRPILVLNKGFSPISVDSLQNVMSLVTGFCEKKDNRGRPVPKANIIDPFLPNYQYTWEDWQEVKASEEDALIHGVSRNWRAFDIIKANSYDGLPQQRLNFSRRTIFKRDGNKCQYCGKKPGLPELNIDHIVPRSKGGRTEWTNCILSCVECNRDKADILPQEKVVKEGGKWVTYYVVCFANGVKRTIKQPVKPKFTLHRSDHRCKSWETFLGERYWMVPLENDMNE